MLWDLFISFFKIGLFTFGGGYAMISLIEDTCVEKKKWLTHEEMMHMTAIAESTPGPVAVNCATFVGLKHRGIPGSISATLGVVMPSFLIIYLISTMLGHFLEIPLVAGAFRGIQVGVGLIIFRVGLKMTKKMPKTPLRLGILLVSLATVLAVNLLNWKIPTIYLLCLSGLVSLAVFTMRKGGESA